MGKSTTVGDVKITWLGHASFLIEGSVTIYIDPYVLPDAPKKADLILITHDHYDHCANTDVLSKDDTVIVTTKAAAPNVSGDVKIVAAGDSVEAKGVKINAVFAYNPAKPFHPKGVGVGFIFTIDGKTIYHAGDTELIPEMSHIKGIDVALLPIGGTYTMDETQAAEACGIIKPKIVIPMHYGTVPQTKGDPGSFENLVKQRAPDTKVIAL